MVSKVCYGVEWVGRRSSGDLPVFRSVKAYSSFSDAKRHWME